MPPSPPTAGFPPDCALIEVHVSDLKQLFTMIRDNLAKTFPDVANAEAVFEGPRAGDVAHSQAAIDKISAALGYAPSHQVEDGMAETVAWFSQRLRRA